MNTAKGVIVNISGGTDMTLLEVDHAANIIRQSVNPEANIIFGSALDESLNGSIRVSLVATGISTNEITENENSEVHNLFENKIEQPSLNKELSNVDFSSSEIKYKEHDIKEEEKESCTDELKFNEIHKTIPSVSNDDNDNQNNEDFNQNGEALEIRNLDDESNNLELNLDDNNQEQSKEIFIPEKTIDVSEIDNTKNFSAKLNSLNKDSEKEEKENSIINRISGFWNKKENTEKTKVLKEPSLESIEKIKVSNKANEQNASGLDILSKEDDKVLEIPAFLRRQVN